MSYNDLKNQLADKNLISQNSFTILKGISALVNDPKTESLGRDLVIRAIVHKELFKKHDIVLESLLRSTGLFPYMTEFISEGTSFQDLLAYEFHRPKNMESNIVLHSLQGTIYQELLNGKNIVLSANTSIGKSMLIDAVLATEQFKVVVLVVPTIALIDETRQRLSIRFKSKCKIITHPSQRRYQDDGIVNIYILTQERLLSRDDIAGIDLFVIDEFYKLDPKLEPEDERAIILNLALYKLLKVSKQFYLIGPNIDSITGLSSLNVSYLFIPSQFSTVAVDLKRYNFTKDDPERNEKLIELVQTLDDSTLIYCQSPRSVSDVATIIIQNCELEASKGLSDMQEWITEEYDEEWIYLKALKYGIGLHHGGIPRALQQQSIKLFNDKKLKFLICSSTIIEGVNTVAKNVIIYDRRRSTSILDYFTYRNIEGRAGRMGKHFVGKVFSLEAPPEEQVMAVNIPIGTQNDDTSLNLLFQMDEGDLSENSKSRIEFEMEQTALSIETIKANLPYSPEKQDDLAKTITSSLQYYKDILVWKGYPRQEQLIGVCNLIFDHLDSKALRMNHIFSGDSLAFHINSLRAAGGISNYFKTRIEEERNSEGPNATIEHSLKILRNALAFIFPRALRALENIQADILFKAGSKDIGNYGAYASTIENLFLDPAIFALDEYGIPLQTAEKLAEDLQANGSLDAVIAQLKDLDISTLNVSNFEKELLSYVIEFI